MSFIEDGQYEGMVHAKLTTDDDLLLGFPNGDNKKGKIKAESGNRVTIQIDDKEFEIRPSNDEDIVNPVNCNGKVSVWFVV